jgi:HK97 gp10 family phage protein
VSDIVTVGVTGLRELDQALSQLPDELARKILVGAMRKGATVVRDEAVRLAPRHAGPYEGKKAGGKNPRRPGTLRESITVRMVAAKGTYDAVTARLSVKKIAWYGRLVEFGHRIVPRLPAGDGVRGSAASMARRHARKAARAAGRNVPPHPFLRPAFDSRSAEVVRVVSDVVGTQIARTWARLNGRSTRRGRR